MRKIDFWCLKHKLLAFILLTLALTGCGGVIFYALSAPVWFLAVYAVITVLINLIYVNFSYAGGVQEAIKDFNNCNPYPLFELAEKILPYVKGTGEQDLILNKTSSLFWMGEHKKMLTILQNLNIDRISGTPLQSKIVYYNNLMCAYQKCGMNDEAMAVNKKIKMLFNDAPQKVRETYKGIIVSSKVFELEADGRYEEALKISLERPENDLLQKVSAAMERAELFISLKEYEKAKTQLKFVYMNGNKTYYVQKAQDMYNELEAL